MSSRPVQYERYVEEGPSGPEPGDWLLFFLRAAMRRKLLFLAVFATVAGASVVYYKQKQPIYRVEAKIFVQRQQFVPSSVRSQGDDSPTSTAWELVHRRENLMALAKAANLLSSPVLPAVSFAEKIKSGDTREDPVERIIKILNKRLQVTTDEGTITVTLDWPDPHQAYRVVDGTVTNFIEARHVQEVTAIEDVMSVLRARAAKAREELGRVTDEVRREGTAAAATVLRETTTEKPRPVPVAAKPPSDELVRIKSVLDGKKRAIEDVEEFRRRRLAELHAQLDERRNTYSDAHPMVVQLKQDIDSLSKESSQVAGLRAEEVQLRKQYEALLAKEGVTDAAAAQQLQSTRVPSTTREPRLRAPGTPVEDDERVRGARFEYQQIEERVNGAQLELDAVRAAFKYRYNIVWPPQVPVDPVSPNPVKIIGAGLLAAFLLAFGVVALPDLRTGRIVERWQVERSLDLPILGEVRRR